MDLSRKIKQQFREDIINTARFLFKRADGIVNDADTSKLLSISITLNLHIDEVPEIAITKKYVPDNNDVCEVNSIEEIRI